MKFLCFMAALFFYFNVCFYNKRCVCVMNNSLFILGFTSFYAAAYFLSYSLCIVNQCFAPMRQSVASMIRIVCVDGVCLRSK